MSLVCSVTLARRRESLAVTANMVLLCALLTRLPALFARPLFDDDYFRFLWDGHQLLSGLSPYALAPAAYFAQALNDPAWEVVLSGINHPDVPTIYGPSLQALFGIAVYAGGADGFALKVIFVLADGLLVVLLLRSGAPPWLVLLYVVNPLPIKEIGFSLHPDGVIALALTLALVSLHRGRGLREAEIANIPFLTALAGALRRCSSLVWLATRRSERLALHPASTAKNGTLLISASLSAAACVAAVVCAKLPLVLLASALDVRSALHRQVLLGGALIALGAYLPFLYPDPVQPFVGLRAFADGWRYNALGFHLFEWLAGAHARVWLCAFYVACAMAVSWAVTTGRLATATAMVLLLTAILLTAPTVNPWYWLPLMPLAILAFQHERVLLITPWIGSFVLLLGYATASVLSELSLNPNLNLSASVFHVGAEFTVLPVATLTQAVVMVCSCGYDVFTIVSGRNRPERQRIDTSLNRS